MDWLLGSPDGQSLLEKAHVQQKTQRLRCQCQIDPGAQAELVVRLRQERYYIACMPGTRHLHDRATCDLFSENPQHSGSGEYAGAIEYDGDVADIKVNFPLKKATPPAHAVPGGRPNNKTGKVKRGSMGLNGLLSHLWSEAGLNSWSPGTVRPWSRGSQVRTWTYAGTKENRTYARAASAGGVRIKFDALSVQSVATAFMPGGNGDSVIQLTNEELASFSEGVKFSSCVPPVWLSRTIVARMFAGDPSISSTSAMR